MNGRSEQPRPRRWRGLILTTLGLVLPFQGGCACGCAAGDGRSGAWGCAPGAAAGTTDAGLSGGAGTTSASATGGTPPVVGDAR